MSKLIDIVNQFWTWTGCKRSWKDYDVVNLDLDPLSFPEFETLRNLCISSINNPLSSEEADAFLLCMALDSEDECILDACKEFADELFLCTLLPVGVSFSQSQTRWQMAELLRKNIPDRAAYLQTLFSDSDSYVRKRAHNVEYELMM